VECSQSINLNGCLNREWKGSRQPYSDATNDYKELEKGRTLFNATQGGVLVVMKVA